MKQNLHPDNTTHQSEDPDSSIRDLLSHRTLIITSNRGPITIHQNERGELEYQRGAGGLVTALIGMLQHAEAHWVACALTMPPPERVERAQRLRALVESQDIVDWLRQQLNTIIGLKL